MPQTPISAGTFPARKSATTSRYLAPIDEEAYLGEAVRRMEVLA